MSWGECPERGYNPRIHGQHSLSVPRKTRKYLWDLSTWDRTGERGRSQPVSQLKGSGLGHRAPVWVAVTKQSQRTAFFGWPSSWVLGERQEISITWFVKELLVKALQLGTAAPSTVEAIPTLLMASLAPGQPGQNLSASQTLWLLSVPPDSSQL